MTSKRIGLIGLASWIFEAYRETNWPSDAGDINYGLIFDFLLWLMNLSFSFCMDSSGVSLSKHGGWGWGSDSGSWCLPGLLNTSNTPASNQWTLLHTPSSTFSGSPVSVSWERLPSWSAGRGLVLSPAAELSEDCPHAQALTSSLPPPLEACKQGICSFATA